MGISEKFALAATIINLMYFGIVWVTCRLLKVSLTDALLMVIANLLVLIFLHLGR